MRCNYCELRCGIHEGGEGRCRMYTCRDGTILEKYPDSYLNVYPASIETVPMMHYYPRHRFLIVSSIGCNFSCRGCVSELLTMHCGAVSTAMRSISPDEMVRKSQDEGCMGIVFCLNEPTVAYPGFLRLAKAAQAEGLKVGCSSNGYMTEEALRGLIPYLDFVNIGLKGYSCERYQECGVSSPAPVLRNLGILYGAGVHLEVSVMYIRGREAEVLEATEFLASLSPDIPLQVMRFMPFGGASDEMEPRVSEAEALCSEARKYLRYVYLFNSIGTDLLNTHCPECGATLIRREFFGPMGAKLTAFREGAECTCGCHVPMVGDIAEEVFEEPRFLGGYRITRGLESIHELLMGLGVYDEEDFERVWAVVMNNDYMSTFHERMENIPRYLETLDEFARLTGTEKNASRITSYLEGVLEEVRSRAAGVPAPRVYFTMGHPLISLHASKLENTLVEIAGGFSLNKKINSSGHSKGTLSAEEINALNPEIIFFTGNMGLSVPEFYEYCHEAGIDPEAVRNHRIFRLPANAWGFGSPEWFLGLLNIANLVHPEIFSYDLDEEAERFEREFLPSDQAPLQGP